MHAESTFQNNIDLGSTNLDWLLQTTHCCAAIFLWCWHFILLDFQGRLKQNFNDIGSFEEHLDEDLDVSKTETSWNMRVGIITNTFQSL